MIKVLENQLTSPKDFDVETGLIQVFIGSCSPCTVAV